MRGLGYTFGPGAADVVYMIYDGNISFGTLTLNGAEVTFDDLLVEGAEYYVEKF